MKRTKLLGLMAALSPALALAEMSYDTFDISYVDVEIDGANVDGDGFELAGSYGLNSKVFLFGSWQDQDLDFGIDGREIEVGAGLQVGPSAVKVLYARGLERDVERTILAASKLGPYRHQRTAHTIIM